MKDLIIAASITAGSFILGLIIEKIVLARIAKLTEKTKWRLDDVVLGSLRGVMVTLFTLFGLRASVPYLPFSPGIESVLSKVVLVAILLAVTVLGMRLLGRLTVMYANTVLPASTSIFKNIVNIIVLVFGLLMIFQTLGINITPMITALGVGGLAVALALQDTLSNLFAGLHLIAVKQIRPNDYVKLNTGEEGYVVDIGWRNTTIRMLRNNLIIVPNTVIASSIITNYFLPEKTLSTSVEVGVSYASDLDKVEKVTKEVARNILAEVPGGVPDFEPIFRYYAFDDSSINFRVILRSKEFVDQYLLRHEFIKALHKRFNEEGIEIPFPIRTVYMHEEGVTEKA
jgi:small-conductance mechanosensitive channel